MSHSPGAAGGATRNAGRGTKGVPRQQREEEILDAASVEFAERGYAGGSVRRIAEAVGVSRAMVHAYYATKDVLYEACVHRAGRPLVSAVSAAQTASDPWQRALDTLEAFLVALDGHRHDWSLIFDRTLDPSSGPARAGRPYRRELARLGVVGASEVLADSGVHDPADADLLGRVWLAVVDTMIGWWVRHPEETPEDAVARFERIAAVLGPRRT